MAELKLSENKFFRRAKKKAEEVAGDRSKLNNVLTSTREKLDEIHLEDTKVFKLGERIKILVRMMRAYAQGSYKEIPWRTMLVLLAAIIYFLMPLDLIPDFIPVSGFIDDFTVVMLVSGAFQQDIQEFLDWEKSRS